MLGQDEDTSASNATLLTLPRELRDLILVHLINEVRPVPLDPQQAQDRSLSSSSPCTIYHEPNSPRPALLQLKLCNHQLHDEVQDAIVKHTLSDKGPAHLDVMIQDSSIWPTWRSLPVTPFLDSELTVTLRIFEATDLGFGISAKASRALWTLFKLLVYHGPCLNHSRGLERPLKFTNVKFDLVLCSTRVVDDLPRTYRDLFNRIKTLADSHIGLGHIDLIEARLGTEWKLWLSWPVTHRTYSPHSGNEVG